MRSLQTVLFLAGVFAAFPPGPAAQIDTAARLLDEGNRSFREGDFEHARLAYENALEHGFESGTVYFNLGNAYFRMDRLGKAMLNYQRAARLLPGDPELEHNIDLVRARSRDELSILPRPIWARWWGSFVDSVGLAALYWVGIIAWLAGMGLLGWRLYTGNGTAGSRRVVTVLLIVGVLAGGGSVATSMARSDHESAVVTSERADVLEGPSNGSRTVIVVHEALVVEVLGEIGQWAHVRLPNGVTGYVERETIDVV